VASEISAVNGRNYCSGSRSTACLPGLRLNHERRLLHVNNAGDISDISDITARFVAFVAFVARGAFYSRGNPSLCCPPACWNLF
jgi:hypothetical protein